MSSADASSETLPASLFYRLLSGSARTLARLDFAGMRPLATGFGETLWACLPSRRRLATNNIMDCLGLGPAEARDMARESFHHNAMSFLEAVLAPRFGLDHPLLRQADTTAFTAIMSSKQPVVAAVAHLGAWELEAGLLGEFRPDGTPRVVVVRRYSNPAVNRLMCELRGARGAQVLGHRDAVMSVLRALKKNGLVAFLVDHNTNRDEALFLPFLGKMAAVNRGPALLAVRANALIWPFALLRQDAHYVAHVAAPLDTTTLEGDTETRTLAAARFYTEATERLVRLAPEQWFWMHNRWKTKQHD